MRPNGLALLLSILAAHAGVLFLMARMGAVSGPASDKPAEPLQMVMVRFLSVSPDGASAASPDPVRSARIRPAPSSPAPRSKQPPSAKPLAPAARPQTSPALKPSGGAPAVTGAAGSQASNGAITLAQSPPAATGGEGQQPLGSVAVASADSSSAASGTSSPPRYGAAYLSNPAPKYPPMAKRMGQQGRVMLRVLVSADGLAKEVALHASSGVASLDESAIKTVRQWRFIPAKRGDSAIEAWVQVPIVFKLEQ